MTWTRGLDDRSHYSPGECHLLGWDTGILKYRVTSSSSIDARVKRMPSLQRLEIASTPSPNERKVLVQTKCSMYIAVKDTARA